MHEKRVKTDETRVGVNCARFFAGKKTGKNKITHGMATYTKRCETIWINEIGVIGELANAKMMIKARVGIV